jgi:hypothetical protein
VNFDDEAIRSRLHTDAMSTGSSTPASVVFGQLRPRLRRARRRRQIAMGTTGVMIIGAMAAAFQFGLGAGSTTIRTYGENEGGLGVSERTVGSARTDEADPSDRAVSTTSHGSVTTTSTTEPTTSTSAPVPASSGIGVPATPIPEPPPVAGTEAPAPANPNSSVEAGTQPPTSSMSTHHQIDSVCGSIIVATVDERVDLIDVIANDGFDVDVGNDGPSKVEVSLEGGGDECELEARVVGGQLVTSVEGPDEQDEPGEQADAFKAHASDDHRSEMFRSEMFRSDDDHADEDPAEDPADED